jgi:hypothetical protein
MPQNTTLYLGNTHLHTPTNQPTGHFVHILGESYYSIRHYDQMPPFFMSLVSSANHWLFIASTGGLTAGRTNADSALFPYDTDDKITASTPHTGSKTILRVQHNGRIHLWEPLTPNTPHIYTTERHLYKNVPGSKLIFEEINHDLQLTWRTIWRTGDRFGFIKTSWLQNNSATPCTIELLDGVQNVLPYGATAQLQNTFSNLLHAYKRNELDPSSGLGIFSLSATLTDRAEPSESLQATTVWQTGLTPTAHLLSTAQVAAFASGCPITTETDICGKAGAYLVQATCTLEPAQAHQWHIVADLNQDSTAVTHLTHLLTRQTAVLEQLLEADIAQNNADLIRYVAAADGLQSTAAHTTSAHHFANVLFNIMRGGIFAHDYQIQRTDLLDFMHTRNRTILTQFNDWFATLPATISIQELIASATATDSADLIRLCLEYLPLTFSRRHGDPSRPWNQFSINIKHTDGSQRLDYQGNWRDIFQNWEPLALAFPAYTESIIAKFLNATTADGYNPYRVTRVGVEWEVPEPENPWANIGYWSDHQIIYLQKLLETADHLHPGSLRHLWQRPIFAYANVPYRLRPYEEMLADWYNTISFDWEAEEQIKTAVTHLGSDGRLLTTTDGSAIIHATMTEKLLVLLLAKLTNLVPEGGIWMSTQRPEWNDANNALVGKGLSVVTAAYLYRFITFWQDQLAQDDSTGFTVNTAVAQLLTAVHHIFTTYAPHTENGFTPTTRRATMDALGAAATAYRQQLYAHGLPTDHTTLPRQTLAQFLSLAHRFIRQTLQANRQPDGLYHAYNILNLGDQTAVVSHLYPMLEGQVAILSSGLLTPAEAAHLLQSLRHSDLYRADQHTYMLYPNRTLPGFRHKNNIPADQVAHSPLVAALTAAGDTRLLRQDADGVFHFNGRYRNANDAAHTLDQLAQEPAYAPLVAAERTFILDLFETTFTHRTFTGRSGTFFAYEGLGSIYWHMVAKLLLATQECYQQSLALNDPATAQLAAAYHDIRSGLGFNKTPAVYGAFPTDPYSHTPSGSGARQPGMTGQVKEEILTRWGELGLHIHQGQIHFQPTLLHPDEFHADATPFTYYDAANNSRTITLPPNSLAFTYCQTPILYTQGRIPQIVITDHQGNQHTIPGSTLDAATTQDILQRNGRIQQIHVTLPI